MLISSLSVLILEGQPPLIINLAISYSSYFLAEPHLTLLFKISLIDTSPVESPDSYKLIGYILKTAIRPAPEWNTSSSSISFVKEVEPVKINFPLT